MNLHDGLEFLARWTQPLDTGAATSPPGPAGDTAPNSERLQTKYGAARVIRQLRVRAGLSQQELAARLQLSVPEIVAIEVGEADCLRTLQVSEAVRRLVG